MKDTVLKESTFEFSLDDRGFYYVQVAEGEEFTVSDFGKISQFIQSSYNDRKAPFIVEFGYGCTFAEGVEEYLTTSPNRFSTADAFIINTYAHELIVKFYMLQFEIVNPTEIFDNKESAIEWIQQYLD